MEANYVNCPIFVIFYWFKKTIFKFISQTIIKETIDDVHLYSETELWSNEGYNEVLLPQNLKGDYLSSLQLYSTNLSIQSIYNLGKLEGSKLMKSELASTHSQWHTDYYESMKNTFDILQKLKNMSPYLFSDSLEGEEVRFYNSEEGRLLQRLKTKAIDIDNKNYELLSVVDKNITLSSSIQK